MIGKLATCARIPSYILNLGQRETFDKGANALGTRCHDLVEAYLKTGALPDLEETIDVVRGEKTETAYPGAIAREALSTLPAPTTEGLEIEIPAEAHAEGITFFSRADFRHRTATGTRIGDHKFVRDLGSAKSATPGATNSYDEPCFLGDDPQALIVAACELEARPELSSVEATWHYTQTRATRGRYPSRVVALRLTREDVRAGLERACIPAARRILEIKRLRVLPNVLPPKAESCRVFGRACDYTERCSLTDEERMIQTMTTNDPAAQTAKLDAALANVRAIVAQTATSAGAPPPPPPPPPGPR